MLLYCLPSATRQDGPASRNRIQDRIDRALEANWVWSSASTFLQLFFDSPNLRLSFISSLTTSSIRYRQEKRHNGWNIPTDRLERASCCGDCAGQDLQVRMEAQAQRARSGGRPGAVGNPLPFLRSCHAIMAQWYEDLLTTMYVVGAKGCCPQTSDPTSPRSKSAK